MTLAGFGTIVVCDRGTVEASNLNRQFLHDQTRIGVNKVLSAKETAARLNPHLEVVPVTERLTRENARDLMDGSEIIFDRKAWGRPLNY